ncbi:MAG: hypothetical protein ABI824_10850 [Acidobacteriota bacterium]
MQLSRRQLAQSLTAISIAGTAGLSAQVPAATQELDRVRASARAAAQRVARVNLPMSTEPATQFKAKI